MRVTINTCKGARIGLLAQGLFLWAEVFIGRSPSCPRSAVDIFTFQPEATQKQPMLKRDLVSDC